MSFSSWLIALSLGVLVACSAAQQCLSINIADPNVVVWDHYWEKCVGSGRAYLGMREDWRRDLKQSHDELGFQMVRFHDILDDDMNVVRVDDQTGELIFGFYNVDQVYDYILSIGMKPLVELSFVPSQIALNTSETIFWYKAITSGPKDLSVWSTVIKTFVGHLVDRYGLDEVSSWYFEVWNEPNCGFYAGTKEDFWKLTAVVADAVHAVNPNFKVGGPVTCQNGWVQETVDLINQGTLNLDFISSHMYPTDFGAVTVDIMKQRIGAVKAIVGNQFPLFYTEFNDGLYFTPPYHDTPFAATFAVKNIVDLAGITDLLSWWTFSDVFDEGGQESQPFFKGDGWGLIALYNIPKPSYRAFQLLHATGTFRLPVTSHSPVPPTFGSLATKNATHATLLFWNHNLPNMTAETPTVTQCISIAGYSASVVATMTILDDTHGNAPRLWQKMGSPAYPTQAQIAALKAASELKPTKAVLTFTNGSLLFNVTLKPYSIASYTFPLPSA